MLEVPLQPDPRLSFPSPSIDTTLKLVASTLLQAPRELVYYSTTAGLTHHYPSILASPALHVQDCAPHRLEVYFTFIFSALVRLVWDSLRVWRMNEQNEIWKLIVTWVIYTCVLRQPLKIFYSWPQEEIYFILWLSTFIYIMEKSNEINNTHIRMFLIYSIILFYSILSYSTLLHSIPFHSYFSTGFPRSRPWNKD